MVTNHEMEHLRDRILEMVDFIDHICSKYNIKYSISYGTLIGAVRHEGFIPWDEDFDIMMDRNNYEKFLEVVDNEISQHSYTIRNRRKDRNFNQTFTKLIDLNSEYITQYQSEPSQYNGIFVDIFPFDKFKKGRVYHAIIIIKGCAYKLVTKRKQIYVTKSVIHKCIRRCIPHKLLDYIERKLENSFINSSLKLNKNFHFFCPAAIREVHYKYNENLFKSFFDAPFENRKYMVTSDYDSFLKETYGEYMNLPPVGERVSRHKLIRVNIR